MILRVKSELFSLIAEVIDRAIKDLRKYVQVVDGVSHLHKSAPVSLGGLRYPSCRVRRDSAFK